MSIDSTIIPGGPGHKRPKKKPPQHDPPPHDPLPKKPKPKGPGPNGPNGPNGPGPNNPGPNSDPFPSPPPPTTGAHTPKDRYASYLSIIESWGIDINSGIIAFAHHAAGRNWSTGTFLYFARQTSWYKEHFRYIKPGMSEGEYNAAIKGYMQTARSLNLFITLHQAQELVKRGVSLRLFTDRVTAVQRVTSQKGFYQSFEDTLRAQGIIKKGQTVTRTELYRFAMHKGPEAWDAILNETYARTAASEAGLTVGANISRKEVMRIAGMVGLTPAVHGEAAMYGLEQKLEQGFQKFVQNKAQLGGFGSFLGTHLTREEQESLAFGGPKAVQAAAKAQSIISAYQEAIKGAMQPQLVETTGGAKVIGGLEGLHPGGLSR